MEEETPQQQLKELLDFSELLQETGAWHACLNMAGGRVFDILHKRYGEHVERRGDTSYGRMAKDAKKRGATLEDAVNPEALAMTLEGLGMLNSTGRMCRAVISGILESERANGDIEVVFEE